MKTTPDNSDKIIRDKINSLDSLPEEYTPSLDSKFELLMAGMQQPAEAKIVATEEKKDKKRFFYLYAAAACFLLLFTFGWLFLREDKIAGNQVAIATEKPVEISAVTPDKMAAAAQTKTSETASSEIVPTGNTTAPAKAKKPAAKTQHQQTTPASATPITTKTTGPETAKPENVTGTNPTQITSPQPEQLLATATSAKPAKTKAANRKRPKAVELDFEPEHVITPSKHDPQVAQQNLKFKFLPINQSGHVAQHQSVLKLKHTF